jgi:cell division protein FtsI/penicillin-binding protein 2
MDDSGSVLAERWPAGMDSDSLSALSLPSSAEAIAPGSLVKPFLAIAYGEQHDGKFPIVRCTGTSSHCWFPAGHGSLDLEEAVTQSCNTYFLELAEGLDRRRAARTFERYGLGGPDPAAPAEALIGLGNGWKESPMALVKAYLQLEKERQHPMQSRILKGMLGSAERGTGRGVDAELGGSAALAKTGTAPCSHKPAGAADGFTIVLFPAVQPRLLLLVRAHDATGAASAKVAGAMLRSLGVSAR